MTKHVPVAVEGHTSTPAIILRKTQVATSSKQNKHQIKKKPLLMRGFFVAGNISVDFDPFGFIKKV